MRHILLALVIMLLLSLPVFAIRAGGWIFQDAVWTQENNPYIVHSFLYIAEGVTLTIEPGVQVLVNGASISEDWYDFFWNGTINNPIEPIAKMIVVHGKIVARGTEENPIVFDTWQSDQLFRWGGIHFTENASKSEFEYCHINRTFMGIINYTYPNSWGALCVRNGRIYIKNCTFETNTAAISCGNLLEDTVIYGCKFTSYNLNGFHFTSSFISAGSNLEDAPTLTIARCEFSGTASDIRGGGSYREVIFNKYVNFKDTGAKKELSRFVGSYNMYGNESYNSQTKFFCVSNSEADTVYCRRNYIYKPLQSGEYASLTASGPGYNVLSDNYGYGQVQFQDVLHNSDIYNNILETSSYTSRAIDLRGFTNIGFNQPRIYNNLFRNFPLDGYTNGAAIYCWDASPLLFNNTIINYSYTSVGTYSSTESYNNIMDGNIGYNSSYVEGHPHVFMNNCVDTPVPLSFDGGGNIVVNPQYADSLGGDFSLAPGSPCIDAGVILADLPAFDINYHKRVSSSYAGGPRAVDMGAYEYNSVYIGGISGYVYDAQSQSLVDCVKIEIVNKLPEFSDTLGCFQYPSGAGIYTVKASRWDYQDLIIPNVTVSEGEDTILNIPLVRTNVANEDNNLSPEPIDFGLANYPNPFNPTTTISFIAPEAGITKLSVFNIKGQRVNMLYDGLLSKGHHSIVWSGLEERGTAVSSGVYFVRVEMNGISQTHKMILMK